MNGISVITDKSRKPDLTQISSIVGNPLFDRLCRQLSEDMKALCSIEYSGDNVLLGWNVRFYKAGKMLCRLYPREGFFTVLIVVGRKERERAEAMLPEMSEEMRRIYTSTEEGMGQRWLLFDLDSPNGLYDDLLRLAAVRRESR